MKVSRFSLPFLVSLVATPPFLLVALASAGAGHGDYFWATILFPFTMLSGLLFGSITDPFIGLAVVQYPLYGLMLGNANVKGRFQRYLVGLLLIHSLVVAACFLFLNENPL